MSTIHSQFAQHLGKKILHSNKEYILDGVTLSHLEAIDEKTNRYAFLIDDCKMIVKNLEQAKVENYNLILCVIKTSRKYIPAIEKELEEKEERIFNELCKCSGIEKQAMFSSKKTKSKNEVWTRQIHLTVRQLLMKLGPSDASSVYGQNHATAIWAKKQVLNLIETDKEWMKMYKPAFDVIVKEFGAMAISKLSLEKYYQKQKKQQ